MQDQFGMPGDASKCVRAEAAEVPPPPTEVMGGVSAWHPGRFGGTDPMQDQFFVGLVDTDPRQDQFAFGPVVELRLSLPDFDTFSVIHINDESSLHVPVLAAIQDLVGEREAGTHHTKDVSFFENVSQMPPGLSLSAVSYMRVEC